MNLNIRREPEIEARSPGMGPTLPLNPDLQDQGEKVAEELTIKAGKLNKKYSDQIEELNKNSEKTTARDRGTLQAEEISNIRYKSKLLTATEKSETEEDKIRNLKEETARRIRVYTDNFDGEWHTLNYEQMGEDSEGKSHELNVGLGDILLDPDIQNIAVMTKSGELIKGKKGVATNGPRTGDVGFLDENGDYIATYTGDKFKILSDSEVDTKDPIAVKNYLGFHAKDESTRETMYDNFQRSEAAVRATEVADLQDGKEVSGQIVHKMSEQQTEMTQIIEREFKAAGLSPNVIRAAIVNAWFESAGLQPDIQSKAIRKDGTREKSWGLFQINESSGISEEDCKDPVKNTQTIIKWVKGGRGKTLLKRAAEGAPLSELVKIFCRDIEKAGSPHYEKRIALAKKLFGSKAVETAPATGDSVDEEFNFSETKTGRINVKSNQDSWVIGSSGAQGIESQKVGNTGTIGIKGTGPKEFADNLQKIWGKIEHLKLPKQIVIVGMAANALSSDDPKAIETVLTHYKRIVDFFESKGTKVKIATVQPINPALKTFNEALRKKYPTHVAGVDFEKAIRDENGKIREGLSSGDGLHVNGRGYEVMAKMVNEASKQSS